MPEFHLRGRNEQPLNATSEVDATLRVERPLTMNARMNYPRDPEKWRMLTSRHSDCLADTPQLADAFDRRSPSAASAGLISISQSASRPLQERSAL